MDLENEVRSAFKDRLDPVVGEAGSPESLATALRTLEGRAMRSRVIALGTTLALIAGGVGAFTALSDREPPPATLSDDGPVVTSPPTPSLEPTPTREETPPAPTPTSTEVELDNGTATPVIVAPTAYAARFITQPAQLPMYQDDPLIMSVHDLQTGDWFEWALPGDATQVTLIDSNTVMYTLWDDKDYGESLIRANRDGSEEVLFDGSNKASVLNFATSAEGTIALQVSAYRGDSDICYDDDFGILRPNGELEILAELVSSHPGGENHAHREQTIRFSPDGRRLIGNVFPGCGEVGAIMVDLDGKLLNSMPQSRDPYYARWLDDERAIVTVDEGTVVMWTDGRRELIDDERWTNGVVSPDGLHLVHDGPQQDENYNVLVPDVVVRDIATLDIVARSESSMHPLWVDADLVLVEAAITSEESIAKGGQGCRDSACSDGVEAWKPSSGKVKGVEGISYTKLWALKITVLF